MALIVEDGTIVSGAESYIGVTDAATYHNNRGNTTFAGLSSDALREQMLRKATDYMQEMYRLRWTGSRVSTQQALDWPRAWVPLVDAPSTYRSWAAFLAQNVIPIEI